MHTDDTWSVEWKPRRKPIMKGAYLGRRPDEPGIYPYSYHRRRSHYVAAFPHGDGTWYEGPKRVSAEDARRDLQAYTEMLSWLRERKSDEHG